MKNYVFEDITQALPRLLYALEDAPVVTSRVGRTRELTHVGITLTNPLAREVLVPGRKCNIAAQIAETAWVLAGRNDVEWLSRYLPRAADFSDDGETWRSGYGPRLRDFHGVDQLAEIVSLLRKDPETRRAVAVLWDPVVDSQPSKDNACNNWLSFLIRDGLLDLHVAVRSNDVMWGWSGINVFEWSALQEIVAGLVGVGVGQLHFSVTSFHLYERYWEKARKIVEESQKTEPWVAEPSPRVSLFPNYSIENFDDILTRWFALEYDIRTGSPMVAGYIDAFPEPMLRSWLRVLDWWWNGKGQEIHPEIYATALGDAIRLGVKPPWARQRVNIDNPAPGHHEQAERELDKMFPPLSPFLTHAIALHNEKHAAYGDSWKRRGEMLGIMANIARKIDRLGGAETSDETAADTAMDLMIYLAKYQVWLADNSGVVRAYQGADTADEPNALLVKIEHYWGDERYPRHSSKVILENDLRANFDLLEKQVMSGDPDRHKRVHLMLEKAYLLARIRYEVSNAYRGADHD